MLLFNRIRNGRRQSRLGETGTQNVALPVGPSGPRAVADNEVSHSRRRRSMLGRVSKMPMPKMPMPWRRERRTRRSAASAISLAGTDPVSSAAQGIDDPMESFSPVTDNAQAGAILRDDVPDIIASKIQKHHELWYHLAYGRPRDRRVSGGYGMQPARLGGKPLPRPNPKRSEVSGLTHIASWKSRPRLWSDIGSPDANAAAGHRPITSIDYGNADEVVLSNTQEPDGDILKAEDALPDGSPKFMIHPYDRRKVRTGSIATRLKMNAPCRNASRTDGVLLLPEKSTSLLIDLGRVQARNGCG